MKTTQWFRGVVDPVHLGVYQRKYPAFGINQPFLEMYSYWDGNRWYAASLSVNEAVDTFMHSVVSANQGLPWRGLVDQVK